LQMLLAPQSAVYTSSTSKAVRPHLEPVARFAPRR
jgi:hypothetical protein